MKLTAEEALRSIYAAYRLARFDRNAVQYLDGTREAAIRSFWVAVILLPLWAINVVLLWVSVDAPLSVVRLLTVKVLFYVVSWTAFPVLMALISFALYQGHRFALFLAAYNWAQLIQAALLVPLIALAFFGLIPDPLWQTLIFAYYGFVLAYEVFLIRVTLTLGWGEAAGLGVLDIALAFMMHSMSDRMVLNL
ncbi:MAG: hypothetical protein KDA49_16230 [Rhodospirillaceae bacterium]|nr:hypothetical protein [Rhodospirillaceae bacterium]MCA8934024.1 hypothetical protein [Rhodospirillaceae bacterium]